MKTESFFFNLPEELIAQSPCAERGNDRLMVLHSQSGKIEHRFMRDLPELLPQNTLLVFNNSRVRKARIFGINKENGAQTEFLLIKKINNFEWEVLCKKLKKKKQGSVFIFPNNDDEIKAEFIKNSAENKLPHLIFDKIIDDIYLDKYGCIPLPPYIKRKVESFDEARYQNIYAKEYGSIASPTAGLHWTNEILDAVQKRGIECAFLTLHVGLGTFLPVRAENIEDHKMHEEVYSIDKETAQKINTALREKRPITAVGTTALRSLESAFKDGAVQDGENSSSIFIYPGYKFKAVDNLFTNFHTPYSTLLMLVCALAGKENILNAYEAAVKERYHFFSYGDAMLIVN